MHDDLHPALRDLQRMGRLRLVPAGPLHKHMQRECREPAEGLRDRRQLPDVRPRRQHVRDVREGLRV